LTEYKRMNAHRPTSLAWQEDKLDQQTHTHTHTNSITLVITAHGWMPDVTK